mgnify:CR=1 FL=1
MAFALKAGRVLFWTPPMVALNENFVPENPTLGSKNRVGDFFLAPPIASGLIGLQPATASGKNGHAATTSRRVLPITASDIMIP